MIGLQKYPYTLVHIRLQIVYRILKYLKGDPGEGLVFAKRGSLHVEAYTDADYAGSIFNRRSNFDYCTFMGGNLVT